MEDSSKEDIKERLEKFISKILVELNMTQTQIGELLGISQLKVSHLINMDERNYSMSYLFEILNKLGFDIWIYASPNPLETRGELNLYTGRTSKYERERKADC